MATVGVLDVVLRARTSNFVRGITKARRSLRRFSRSIPGANTGILSFGALLTGAAVVGISLMINKQRKLIDSQAKTAKSLNISTEALAGFGLAAELAGGNSADLTKGLFRLQKTIFDATVGLSTAVRAFDVLGLSAEDLIKLPMAEQFKIVTEAMSKMENTTKRTAAGLDIFGKAFQKLSVLIIGGRSSIESAEAAAKQFGITFSEVEGNQIQNANDTLLLTSKIFDGLGKRLTIQVMPIFEELGIRFNEFALSGESATARVSKGFGQFIGVLGVLVDIFEVVRGGFNLLQAVIGALIGHVVAAMFLFVKAADVVLSVFGIKVLNKASSFLGELSKEFALGVVQDIQEAGEAFKSGFSGAKSAQLQKFVSEAQAKSFQRASEQVEQSKKNKENQLEMKNDTFQDKNLAALQRIADGVDDLNGSSRDLVSTEEKKSSNLPAKGPTAQGLKNG